MVILKSAYEKYNAEIVSRDDIMKDVFYFIKEGQLEEKGWINSLLEGGFISPDCSTIYYYARTPYEGQLIQFNSRDAEGFNKIKKEYADSGYFIEI